MSVRVFAEPKITIAEVKVYAGATKAEHMETMLHELKDRAKALRKKSDSKKLSEITKLLTYYEACSNIELPGNVYVQWCRTSSKEALIGVSVT